MTLAVDALTWQGIAIGSPESGVHFDKGVEGLAHVGVSAAVTPRAIGGAVGGLAVPEERTITTDVWLDAQDDFSPLHDLYAAMAPRPHPADELPLSWSGLMWPAEHAVFARPTRCEWLTDEDGVNGGIPGVDLRWVAADPTIYSAEQTTAALWSTGAPVSSDEFEVPNAGIVVPWAMRAWDLRMTAHGTLVRPWMRVTHDDGTWERITFDATLTGGQVLTVRGDALGVVARVGSRRCSVTSLTDLGVSSRAPRWWRLLPSDGEDGANVATVGCSSGTFSGYVKVRSTW